VYLTWDSEASFNSVASSAAFNEMSTIAAYSDIDGEYYGGEVCGACSLFSMDTEAAEVKLTSTCAVELATADTTPARSCGKMFQGTTISATLQVLK